MAKDVSQLLDSEWPTLFTDPLIRNVDTAVGH